MVWNKADRLKPILRKVESNFRAAVHSKRARSASAIHGNFHVTGRAEHGNRLSCSARSKRLRKLDDLLAIHGKLDCPTPECAGRKIFRREIGHQVSKRIDAQDDAFYA